jgi:hypothetical protein
VRGATRAALDTLKSPAQIGALTQKVKSAVGDLEWYGNYMSGFNDSIERMKDHRLRALKAEAFIDSSFP